MNEQSSSILTGSAPVGNRIDALKPALDRDQEAALIDVLREILKDEGEQ